jgi:hypothetical protein
VVHVLEKEIFVFATKSHQSSNFMLEFAFLYLFLYLKSNFHKEIIDLACLTFWLIFMIFIS